MKAKKLFLVVCIIANCLLPTANSFSQGTWAAKAPLPALARGTSVGFTIGTKGYLGTGVGTGVNGLLDFWEYDPIANSWTQKADFGGGQRGFAVGFSIGNFGYIGTGSDASFNMYSDFWRYDPVLNSWIQVASVGGGPREAAVGFSIAGKGYIGTGNNISNTTVQDMWEYDPTSNTWMPKANYMGGDRADIDRAFFIMCNKAYIGTGQDASGNRLSDFWEYDPVANTWSQKANFPGTPRVGATGFSIGARGYLGCGLSNAGCASDFWEYNPFTNSWSPITAIPQSRFEAPAFVINNKAYVGTGLCGNYYNDLWEYTPDSIIGSITATIFSTSSLICLGQSVTLTASGGSSYFWSNGSTNNPIVISPTATTTYSVIASDIICNSSDTVATTITMVNQVVAVIACQDVCVNNSTTLVASGGANYLWSSGAITNAITVSPATTTNYSVIVSVGSCADTTDCTVYIFPAPVVSITSDTTITQGQSANLSASGGGSYAWSNGQNGASITVSPTATTVYCVTVTDANNCQDIACVKVLVEPCGEMYLPNAFSPNGDNENDLLSVYYKDISCIKSFTLIIYDRWGKKIFETIDPAFTWNGNDTSQPMNTAAFAYSLNATLITGQVITKKGNISLMR